MSSKSLFRDAQNKQLFWDPSDARAQEGELSYPDKSKRLTIAVLTGNGDMPNSVNLYLEAINRAGHIAIPVEESALTFQVEAGESIVRLNHVKSSIDSAILCTSFYGEESAMIIRTMETAGVTCLNPSSSVQISSNKFATHARLARSGIPMPRTSLVRSVHDAMVAANKYGFPVVTKLLGGSEGRGTKRFHSAHQLIDDLLADRTFPPQIVQEFVESGSTHTRVVVVGDEVIAALGYRASKPDEDFRSNGDGKTVPFAVELSPEAASIALKAHREGGFGISGSDVGLCTQGSETPGAIKTGQEFFFEINSVPGIAGITKATGIDIAGKAVKHLVEKTLNLRVENLPLESSSLGLEATASRT